MCKVYGLPEQLVSGNKVKIKWDCLFFYTVMFRQEKKNINIVQYYFNFYFNTLYNIIYSREGKTEFSSSITAVLQCHMILQKSF